MHTPYSHRLSHRLGAVGMTVALATVGGGMLLGKCSPAPAPVPAANTIMPIEAQLVSLVNTYRAQNGVPPVGENLLLDNAAENHSLDMAQRQTMTHTGWDGSDPGQRMLAAGYTWRTWGENVAAGQKTVTDVMTAWMNSSGHRANILNPAFNEIGVAAAAGKNGVIYWTMDLATGR